MTNLNSRKLDETSNLPTNILHKSVPITEVNLHSFSLNEVDFSHPFFKQEMFLKYNLSKISNFVRNLKKKGYEQTLGNARISRTISEYKGQFYFTFSTFLALAIFSIQTLIVVYFSGWKSSRLEAMLTCLFTVCYTYTYRSNWRSLQAQLQLQAEASPSLFTAADNCPTFLMTDVLQFCLLGQFCSSSRIWVDPITLKHTKKGTKDFHWPPIMSGTSALCLVKLPVNGTQYHEG